MRQNLTPLARIIIGATLASDIHKAGESVIAGNADEDRNPISLLHECSAQILTLDKCRRQVMAREIAYCTQDENRAKCVQRCKLNMSACRKFCHFARGQLDYSNDVEELSEDERNKSQEAWEEKRRMNFCTKRLAGDLEHVCFTLILRQRISFFFCK